MKMIPVEEAVAPPEMDMMLARGYYRMQQSFFSTHFIATEHGMPARVVWARVCLHDFRPNTRLLRLRKRNRNFRLELEKAAVTDEVEQLYHRYRQGVGFETWPSVSACLLGDACCDHFPGRMWTVRSGEKLIAAGYFDEGATSCAGILNFYDPDFARHSLGLWLYLESVAYVAQCAKRYFYPGYIVIGFPKFDYKLLAGIERIELFEPMNGIWIPFSQTILSRQHTEV